MPQTPQFDLTFWNRSKKLGKKIFSKFPKISFKIPLKLFQDVQVQLTLYFWLFNNFVFGLASRRSCGVINLSPAKPLTPTRLCGRNRFAMAA